MQLLGRLPVSLTTRQSGRGAALSLKIILYLFIFSSSFGVHMCVCHVPALLLCSPRSLETKSLTELELCLWPASLRYPLVFIPHNACITGTYNHTVLYTRVLRIYSQVPYACIPSTVCWPVFPASSYLLMISLPSTACF